MSLCPLRRPLTAVSNLSIRSCTYQRPALNAFSTMGGPSTRRLQNPVLFICDLQEKFAPAIHEFPAVLKTTQKLLKAATILKIPVIATTQQRAKLGNTCSELSLGNEYPLVADVDKTAFSMYVPDVATALHRIPQKAPNSSTTVHKQPYDCILVGIESHICVLQTTLDLLREGNRVWIVQDAVSSVNPEERQIALHRLRQEGAKVTTSESLIYETLGDAGDESFKQIAALIKESKDGNKQSLQALCKI